VGAIQATPEEILEHADWRFLEASKQELAYAPRLGERNFSFYCDPETGPPLRAAFSTAKPTGRTT
jgi:hypothetical protein